MSIMDYEKLRIQHTIGPDYAGTILSESELALIDLQERIRYHKSIAMNAIGEARRCLEVSREASAKAMELEDEVKILKIKMEKETKP